MAPGHRWRRIVWTFAALVVLVGVVLWEPWRDHPQPGGLDPRTLEGIVEIAKSGPEVRGSLAAYWKGELNDADPPIALKRPKAFMPYQVPEYPESACTWGLYDRNNASYCSLDQRISWDEDWFQELNRLIGPVAPLSVLAHEYGHHIADLLSGAKGTGASFSKQWELQADCFSGMYLRYANEELGLSNRELVKEADNTFRSADPESDAPWFASGRHGSGWERLRAFLNGFIWADLGNCEGYQNVHGNLVEQVGPHTIALTPGVRTDPIDDDHLRVVTTTGQTVDVSYLRGVKSTSSGAVLERLTSGLFAFDESVENMRLRRVGPADRQDHAHGIQLQRRYGVSFTRAGQRQQAHGIVQVVVLDDGGAIAFNAFEPGPARGADPSSWPQIEQVLAELQEGIWPE
jgi:hypothetical protein